MASRIRSEVKRFFNNFFKVIKRPDMVLLPGNLSFFFVLAIVPTVALISYFASILNVNTNLIYDFLSNSFFEKELSSKKWGQNLERSCPLTTN